MKRDIFVKNFPVSYSSLSINEKKVAEKLKETIEIIGKIYASQVGKGESGAAFYPVKISKEEIEKKSVKNPRLLSPFTIVKKGKNGELVATPYHEEYKRDLEKVNVILNEAAQISQDRNFSRYLRVCGQSLLDGHYEEMDVAWLNLNGKLDFRIGPFERYLDRLLFRKRAYQAHIGIVNKEETEKAEKIRAVLYANVKSDLEKIHQVVPLEKIEISVEDNLAFGGFLAQFLFSEEHFPCDLETSQKYGSRVVIYLSTIKYKFENLIYPIFEKIFEEDFKKHYPKDILLKGNFYYLVLTSLARQLHRYQNSRERLKELFPVFDEATAAASGIKYCKHLVMEGVMGQKELEAIIIAHFCWTFAEWVQNKNNKARADYLKGDALNVSFYFKEKALKEKDGLFWPDFSRIFFTIENLADTFIDILSWKSYNEAQKFLEEYLTFRHFKKFDKKLKSINFP